MLDNCDNVLETIKDDDNLKKLWSDYQKRNTFAKDINYSNIIASTKKLINGMI